MAAAEKPPPTRIAHLTRADSITVRPVRWLWDERIALGTLCLIGGREGVGKSLITYTLAAQITRGTLPGVYFGTPKAVIVAASEDSWEHTIVPRLLAAGADLLQVFRLHVQTTDGSVPSLLLPIDQDELKRMVLLSHAALVVLDPLLSRISATLDTHKDAEVRQALEPIVTLADETGVCIMGLIHVNKSASADPLTLLMGSRAFVAVARSVLFVLVDPNDATKRILGQAKNNLGRMDLRDVSFQILSSLVATTIEGEVWTGRVDWLGDSPLTLHDAIAASTTTTTEKTDRADAADWLTDYLSGLDTGADSAKVKRAAQQAGHSIRTLQRAREAIGIVITSVGFPRKSHWSLPLASNGNGHDTYEV